MGSSDLGVLKRSRGTYPDDFPVLGTSFPDNWKVYPVSWGMYLSFSNSKFILSNLSIYLFYLVQIGEGAKLRFAPF